MIFKQDIKSTETNELNNAGRHIKVINAAAALRLRVFGADGSLMLDSEVRSGFELEMPAFAKATVSSDVNQSYEIWVSADKLGYNAPSANANNLISYKAPHYGDTDLILPFEPSRLSARVVSDAPWWYGGANVDKENGMPVAAGEIAEIRGAAAISAAIGIKGEYLPTVQAISVASGKTNYASISNAHGMFSITNDNKLVQLNEQGYKQIAPLASQGDYVMCVCNVGENKIAYAVQYSNYFYELDLITGKVKNFRLPNVDSQGSVYVSKINRIAHNGEKYVFITNGRDVPNGYDGSIAAITTFDGSEWVHRFRVEATNFHWRQIWSVGGGSLLIETSRGIQLIQDVDLLPENEDLDALIDITTGLGGLDDYMQFSIYGDYCLIQGQGGNSEAALVNRIDNTVVRLGMCDASAISEAGVVLVKGGEFHITKDLGQSYEIKSNPLAFGGSSRNYLGYVGSRLYIMASSFTGYYVTEKVRITPKQNFRVLKAFS